MSLALTWANLMLLSSCITSVQAQIPVPPGHCSNITKMEDLQRIRKEFKLKYQNYTYSIKMGDEVLRIDDQSNVLRLGRHSQYDVMSESFTNGEKCNDITNSTILQIVFGPTTEILKAEMSSNACQYIIILQISTSDATICTETKSGGYCTKAQCLGLAGTCSRQSGTPIACIEGTATNNNTTAACNASADYFDHTPPDYCSLYCDSSKCDEIVNPIYPTDKFCPRATFVNDRGQIWENPIFYKLGDNNVLIAVKDDWLKMLNYNNGQVVEKRYTDPECVKDGDSSTLLQCWDKGNPSNFNYNAENVWLDAPCDPTDVWGKMTNTTCNQISDDKWLGQGGIKESFWMSSDLSLESCKKACSGWAFLEYYEGTSGRANNCVCFSQCDVIGYTPEGLTAYKAHYPRSSDATKRSDVSDAYDKGSARDHKTCLGYLIKDSTGWFNCGNVGATNYKNLNKDLFKNICDNCLNDNDCDGGCCCDVGTDYNSTNWSCDPCDAWGPQKQFDYDYRTHGAAGAQEI